MTIDVIDLFAGPGGLGEGFASLDEGSRFKIAVSVEMEASAHKTLMLRSFYRHSQGDQRALQAYYNYCNRSDSPHPRELHPALWRYVEDEARQLTLGVERDNNVLRRILDERKLDPDRTIVIGGPPCQAYSLVGRSKNQGTAGYVAEDDHRHFLYREYLKILNRTQPAAFIMENVKGILSSKVGGRQVFHDILRDLCHPGKALRRPLGEQGNSYRICSLVSPTFYAEGMDPSAINASDFVIKAEEYGVPQARHRVILLGIRNDLAHKTIDLLPVRPQISVRSVLSLLPPLRSRLSSGDDAAAWSRTVKGLVLDQAKDAAKKGLNDLSKHLTACLDGISGDLPTGALRVAPYVPPVVQDDAAKWFCDSQLSVWLNHEARSHMNSDLGRYFFAAAFGEKFGRSPKGHTDFCLEGLSPNHANWTTGKFEDRFRVQLYDLPATTVTSHIAKDGHYFIHPDPTQCRSLTVREAARLQTFPDNYFFQGNRTQQYHQVGNAVPPLLALQIAQQVSFLLNN